MAAKKSKTKKTTSRLGVDPFNIFQEIKDEESNRYIEKNENLVDNKSVKNVPISSVSPDPNQPRQQIDAESESIKELAKSIKKHGFINFITVREENKGKYIIIAGERRYTAAKKAGLAEIPVIIASKDKQLVDYAVMQIEENLQREDLSIFDEVEAYHRLASEFKLQQKEIVNLVQKNKSYISKMMNLHKLSPKIKDDIKQWEIEVSRDILWELSPSSQEEQEHLWKRIRNKPVRSALDNVKKQLAEQQEKDKGKKTKDSEYNVEAVWDALKRAVSKDKGILLEVLTKKKIDKLLQDFGE